MKSLCVCFFLLLVFCCSSYGQDDQCKNDFTNFFTCAKSQISPDERKSMKSDIQSKASACFEQAGCAAPDPNSGLGGRANGIGRMQMPDSVKQCLKRKILDKVGAKLGPCLARKGFNNVNFSEIADSMEGSGAEVGISAHGDADGNDQLRAAITAKLSLVKGVDKCDVDHYGSDTEKVKPLEQCLQNIKQSIKPRVCNDLKPCINAVGPNCKQRGQALTRALCQCKQEKEKEISSNLATLGRNNINAKVSVQDLLRTVADDQDISDIMKTVDACYAENNEQEPPMLKLASTLMSGKGGGRLGAAMSFDGRTVVIMSDMIALDANDPSECDPCQ